MRKKLDLGCAGIAMTPDEFDDIEFADLRFRYELINGIVVVSRRPRVIEQDLTEELGYLLWMYQDNHPHGSTIDYSIHEWRIHSGNNRRIANRLVWTGLGRLPDLESGYNDIASIAIDCVTPSKKNWMRNYEEKSVEYMALGIREYWVFHRFERNLSVFRSKAPDGPAKLTIVEGRVYQTPVLPGFELPVGRLLSHADSWTQPQRAGSIKKAPPPPSNTFGLDPPHRTGL